MDFRRAYILMKLSESLTDEERAFLAGQGRELTEIKADLEKIKKQGSFGRVFASNIAGNAVFDGFVWLVSRLIKRLR